MRIGILADIHDAVEPLRSALDTFRRAGVDRVIARGDAVDGNVRTDADPLLNMNCHRRPIQARSLIRTRTDAGGFVRKILESIEGEYRRYKMLGEGAMAQLTDAQLLEPGGAGTNSIATIVWHLSGNLASRFTDFMTSDGEKPWRDRDNEFLSRIVSREELLEKWEAGWIVLFTSLAELDDEQLQATVTIRGVPHSVAEALHRSLAHASYHVGQIVFLAKTISGGEWRYLSVPPGGTAAYNENPVAERPPEPSR